MEVAEHIYADDPTQGPPDVKTTLDGVDYFFLGNGLIQAAVQVCTSGQGTAVGLLVLHPERLGPKRQALTLDPILGLAPTAVTVRAGGREWAPRGASLEAQWTDIAGVPAVRVVWQDDDVHVEETFHCPTRSSRLLVRGLKVWKSSPGTRHATLHTGPAQQPLERSLELAGSAPVEAALAYELRADGERWGVAARWADAVVDRADGRGFWDRCGTLTCAAPTLEHLFRAARNQLPAVVTASGMMDGGIWQYNLEWVRDQACAVEALVALGAVGVARTMLERLLTQFVSDEGACVDSGRRRATRDVELDQNGYLVAALETYTNWTGEVELLQRHWPRIVALVEFPLHEVFRHAPSGLLHNRREYWERHDAHGIQDGMEMIHQLYATVGLGSAARLARLVVQPTLAERWERASQCIRRAMLEDARYGLVEGGRLIKRRDLRGDVQETLTPSAEADLPAGVPLAGTEPHYLDPDTSTALPIALGFIDPRGELARNTLADLERLWNQRWDCGGYGRYHVSSEPDSPGPWPFASLFVAQAYCEMGDDDKVWRVLNWLRRVPGGRAGAWFEFYGPRPIPPCPQIGVIPWTWAEIIRLCIHHLLGVRPGYAELRLRPRLLAGLDHLEARLHLRGHRLGVRVRRARPGERAGMHVGGQFYPHQPVGVSVPMPRADVDVEAVMPA